MIKHLKYDKDLYTEKAIKQAALDYGSIADLTVKNKPSYIEVKLEADEVSIDTIIGEFNNYIIHLENHLGVLQ